MTGLGRSRRGIAVAQIWLLTLGSECGICVLLEGAWDASSAAQSPQAQATSCPFDSQVLGRYSRTSFQVRRWSSRRQSSGNTHSALDTRRKIAKSINRTAAKTLIAERSGIRTGQGYRRVVEVTPPPMDPSCFSSNRSSCRPASDPRSRGRRRSRRLPRDCRTAR